MVTRVGSALGVLHPPTVLVLVNVTAPNDVVKARPARMAPVPERHGSLGDDVAGEVDAVQRGGGRDLPEHVARAGASQQGDRRCRVGGERARNLEDVESAAGERQDSATSQVGRAGAVQPGAENLTAEGWEDRRRRPCRRERVIEHQRGGLRVDRRAVVAVGAVRRDGVRRGGKPRDGGPGRHADVAVDDRSGAVGGRPPYRRRSRSSSPRRRLCADAGAAAPSRIINPTIVRTLRLLCVMLLPWLRRSTV